MIKKKSVPKGIELNDKDYITSLLSYLKEMTKNYAVSLTETSNETLYNKYLDVFKNVSKLQREVYELMYGYGWYKMEPIEKTKLSKKCDMIYTEYKDLSK